MLHMTLRKAEKGISEIRRNSCCTEQIQKPSGDENRINKTNDLRNLPLLCPSQRNTQLPGTQHLHCRDEM